MNNKLRAMETFINDDVDKLFLAKINVKVDE
jgi:hypothetical protein